MPSPPAQAAALQAYGLSEQLWGMQPTRIDASEFIRTIAESFDECMKQEREWMPIETLPPPGDRPGRVFALVQGEKYHSGVRWHRMEFGIAATWNEGIDDADVRLIEKRGDMDPHTGTVTHWLPINLPSYPQPTR